MDNETTAAFDSLFEAHFRTSARLNALDTTVDALIATLGKSFPPLVSVLDDNLSYLAGEQESRMQDADSRVAYRKAIDEVLKLLSSLK